MGPVAMISVFWMLSFKPTFSLCSFGFKRLFSSSLSAITVVSSAYLRLLIFLPTILIPDCASSSPAFLMMYSAHKLNKQGDNIQPWHTPFPIWNQSVVPCPVLTVASWPAYRFLKKQVRWSGIPISFRIFHSLAFAKHLRQTSQVVLVVNNPPANIGDLRDERSVPGSGSSPGEGHSNPLWYCCLESPMERGAWRATVHRVTKSQTWLKLDMT